jgi:DNA-binding NarL/FixJ family response regulator
MIELLPGVAIIALTRYRDDAYVQAMLAAGAKGYVLKDSADIDLIAGIKSVTSGRPYFSATVERLLIAGSLKHVPANPLEDQFWTLTGREREVVQLVAEGRNTRQIARLLGVAAATVSAHRAGAMMKLDLHNTAEIVRLAVRSGVVQVGSGLGAPRSASSPAASRPRRTRRSPRRIPTRTRRRSVRTR